jgi:3-deoxy-D-manno-octulosonic-acid transferase
MEPENGRKTRAGNHLEDNIDRFEELGGPQINIHRKFKIKFQINTKKDMQVDQNMMSQDHKENLNLLFYDFNNG